MIRQQAGLSVERFCAIAGIPRPTWYRQRARALGARPAKGPWPRPTRDRVSVVVQAYALKFPAWGHRKIWALTVADGHVVSQRTVHRILDQHGLLNGHRYQAERRELAKARKATFHDPPTRRNRVWQTDFSELETRARGTGIPRHEMRPVAAIVEGPAWTGTRRPLHYRSAPAVVRRELSPIPSGKGLLTSPCRRLRDDLARRPDARRRSTT